MSYPVSSHFNPKAPYRETWSLAPQIGSIRIGSQKTCTIYNDITSAVPLFYLLMFSAIAMDIYLGFSVLAKSGVSFALITGSIIADLFLAIFPFILESFVAKSLNHVKLENEIFKAELEIMSQQNGESNAQWHKRQEQIQQNQLPSLQSKKRLGKLIRWTIALLILGIAAWKILTFYSVLPPGVSIFSTINGKIVIIFSILCAVFHLIGSEKAFAHFMYSLRQRDFKRHQRTQNNLEPKKSSVVINYIGDYVEESHNYTGVVKTPKGFELEYIYLIRDDEIKILLDSQTDENARRGIAITAKQIQIQ